MKVLLTGGSGDLGQVLAHQLENRGDNAFIFDIKVPNNAFGNFIKGSVLDRTALSDSCPGIDVIVHIASWHGIHEFKNQKDNYDFWDLNVTGTFNVLQTAIDNNIKNVILISSESVSKKNGIYGWTKVLSEQIAQRYFDNHQLNILTLRPRAFIPYWNRDIYTSFIEWAKWYWRGAVHINDVAQAVIKGIDLIMHESCKEHSILSVDGAYEYTQHDLSAWDTHYAGETFKKYYASYYDLAISYGLDPALKPAIQDISNTKKILSYVPTYSLKNLLEELAQYGENGPPVHY